MGVNMSIYFNSDKKKYIFDSTTTSNISNDDSQINIYDNQLQTELNDNGTIWDGENCSPNSYNELNLCSTKSIAEKSLETLNLEDTSKWDNVEAQKNKKNLIFGNDGYTFRTSSDIEITIENPEDLGNIQIYENKETGEVVIINAIGAKIKSNGDDSAISIFNSQIDSINTKKGDDTINIYDSTVNKIDTGKGSDDVSIYNSIIESLETGSGSDIINIDDSSAEKIQTNSGFIFGWFDNSSDTINIENTTIDNIKTGKGNATLIASNSNINTLKTKGGKNSVSLNNTKIAKDDFGEKDLKIENGNYLADFDISKMPKVESSEVITLQSGETITVSDYISLISQQEVGFETKEEYQQYAIQAMAYNLESMKQVFQSQKDSDGIMSNGFSCLKELTGLGISSKDVENIIAEQEEIINALIAAANGQSDLTFEDTYEKYTGTKFSTEKIDNYMRTSNIASAINSACYYDKDYADKLEEATGKSVDEINQEFALCQNEVLGKSQALQNLVDDYSASQEGFADKLSAIISTTGMVCIVAGAIVSFIPGGATIGVPLMTAGKWVAFGGMLTDNAIDLVDHSTDKDGLTSDEVKNLALETGVEVVSYAAGRGIGKLTNGLNTMVANEVTKQGVGKVGSYVLGQTAETFADTALSLTADYAIAQGQSLLTTGEMMSWDDYWSVDRFLGEGRNQLMGILTGLSSSKVNAYSQSVIATAQGKIQAGDIEGAKTYLKQKGLGQYASGTKFNNLQASVNMPQIMPEVNAKIQAGDIEGAKQILSNNGLSNYTTGKNFASIEQQAYISKAQEMIGTGDIEGAKQYLNNNGLEKYSTGDNFKSIQAKANAPQIIAEAQRMILEGNEKGAQEYLKEQGLADYSQRDNFYQLTTQTKAPQIMQEVERLILEGDEAGAKQYLKDNGFKEYTNKENFNAIVNNIKTANMQAQAVETAKTMILEGKSTEAKKLLEDSGLEIDDESFKALSDETLKSENDTDPSTETSSSGNLKIGLQFFADKQVDNIETKGSDDLNNNMNNESQQKQYNEFLQKAISEIIESNGSIETDNILNKIISYYEAEGTPIKTLEELRKTNETYVKILNNEPINEKELVSLLSEIENANLNLYEKLLYQQDIEKAKLLQNSMVGIEFHHSVNGYLDPLRTVGYENLSAQDKQIIDLIDEQFANLPPTEYDINLRRGLSFNKNTAITTQKKYFEKLKNLQQGEILTEKAPIYTTPNEALAKQWAVNADWFDCIMMDIETPSGSKISRVIDGGREEYLFPRDAQFEVTKPYYIDDNGTPRIGLKYIQP